MKTLDKKLTISIVNYNAGIYILNCLKSLQAVKDEVSMEIYVVDNASTDDSIEKIIKEFPEVKVIENKENLGFGKAHNQVLKIAETEYILILNPDVEIEKGVLKTAVEFMNHHTSVGVVTGQVILSDGRIDLTAHRGLPTPLAAFKYYFLKDDSLYHLSKSDMSLPHEVDSVSGAFLLTRKSILESVGYFDEDYFMYAEDIDLCYRISTAGYKIMYLPGIKILHHKGISTGLKKHTQQQTTATLDTRKKMTGLFYDTMKIFYKKHLAKNYPFFINWIVYLGIDTKHFLAKRKLIV